MERDEGVKISGEVYRELLEGNSLSQIPENSYVSRFVEFAEPQVKEKLVESWKQEYGGNPQFLYLLSGALMVNGGLTPEIAAHRINTEEIVYGKVKKAVDCAWKNKIELENFDLYFLTKEEAKETGIEGSLAVIKCGNRYLVPVEKMEGNRYLCVDLSDLQKGVMVKLNGNKISAEMTEAPKYYAKIGENIAAVQGEFINEFNAVLYGSFSGREQFAGFPPERRMWKEKESRGRIKNFDPVEDAIFKGDFHKAREFIEGYNIPVNLDEILGGEESENQ